MSISITFTADTFPELRATLAAFLGADVQTAVQETAAASPILQDATWTEGTLPPGDKLALRTSEPKPARKPAAKPEPEPEPVAEPDAQDIAEAVTYDDVRAIVNKLATTDRNLALKVLADFEVKTAKELTEDQWADFVAAGTAALNG